MNTQNKKGIIYCRVSSHDQVSGTSLESQKQACLVYAEREGITVGESEIFIERGESATAANRTELIKVLEYCRKNQGKVQAFIVWKVDRFARNQTDHFALRGQLMKYGVRLHSVTEPLTDDPIGKMTEGMLAAYAQFENDIRKQRCEGGMQRKVEQGIWPWMPPIGYKTAIRMRERRKTQPDEPDEERFYLIQKGLKTYATGKYSAVEVSKLLTTWGMKTRTGKPMGKQLMERVLKDPYYAGILTNPWTGEQHKGQHRAMISWEEYEQIQSIKRGLSRHLNRPRSILNPDFPLRRFVTCTCGGKLTASWHTGWKCKKYASYNCHNKQCVHNGHSVPKDVLEGKFFDLLTNITPKEEFLALFEEIVLDVWKDRKTVLQNERINYQLEIKKLETRKEQLLQMRLNGEISPQEFTDNKNSIDNRVTGFKISQNETHTDELDMGGIVSYATDFIRSVARQWQEMNIKQRQRLQKLVLPECIVYDKVTDSFGTAILSPIFKLSQDFSLTKSDLVAGARIERASGGYAYHYNFHCPLVCGLDYAFNP